MNGRLKDGWLPAATAVMLMALPGELCAEPSASSRPIDPPSISASALYMVDLKSGRVLLQKEPSRRLPPASLTKIMTALVALESAPLDSPVTIDPRALLHRSSLGFRAGEQFALGDLLTAMLVNSANDACEAIALHVAGSQAAFVAKMNERARALKLENTQFSNPCGFDAPNHYSTAADLAMVTDQALRRSAFSMMVRTLTRDIATLDGTRRVALHSTNEMLLDPDVTGVKTGYTSKAGRCLIVSMFKDGHRVLLVGLNVRDRWEQAARLLRYGHTVLQAAKD